MENPPSLGDAIFDTCCALVALALAYQAEREGRVRPQDLRAVEVLLIIGLLLAVHN